MSSNRRQQERERKRRALRTERTNSKLERVKAAALQQSPSPNRSRSLAEEPKGGRNSSAKTARPTCTYSNESSKTFNDKSGYSSDEDNFRRAIKRSASFKRSPVDSKAYVSNFNSNLGGQPRSQAKFPSSSSDGPIHQSYSVGDSDDSDSDPEEDFRILRALVKAKPKLKEPPPASTPPPTYRDEPCPSSDESRKQKPSPSKTILNPWKLEQRERQRSIEAARSAKHGNTDLLWSDSEPEDEAEEDKVATIKAAKGRKSNGTRTAKKKQAARKSASHGYADESYSLEVQASGLEDDLKPEFDAPHFGPFSLEPIRLGDSQYQVPSAIARYLPDFQRKGIQFMNEALTKHGGAILGDDMGLGKTIQTVALVAAYLEKTGTNKDFQVIKERRQQFRVYEQQKRQKEDEALTRGTILWQEDDVRPPKLKAQAMAPILIVVPVSVMDNWKEAFDKWGHFPVVEYRDKKGRQKTFDQILHNIAEVALCPHSVFGDAELLKQLPWKLVVVDEFHKFKNERGKNSKHLRSLKDSTGCKIVGLTGTLMQNNYKELWNLVDMVKPNCLGDYKEFKHTYEGPIKLGMDIAASSEMTAEGGEKAKELYEKFGSFYLRREKEVELANILPEKEELVIMCEPSSIQKKLYEHLISLPDFVILSAARGPCDCGMQQRPGITRQELVEYVRRQKKNIVPRSKCCYKVPTLSRSSTDLDPRAVLWRQAHDDCEGCRKCPYCVTFKAMPVLDALCSHAALLQAGKHPDHCTSSEERVEAEMKLERAKVFIPPHLRDELPGGLFRRTVLDNDHASLSGKIKYLGILLEKIEKRQGRALIFSVSIESLNLIQSFIKSKGYSFYRMDGSTCEKKRQEIQDKFNADSSIFIFLGSTKASGTGLNLTGANNVILYDVEWNPANDSQAQDRAYRIGQSEDVNVYRLVCRGTIEEQKYLRQLYKGGLKDEVLFDPTSEAGNPKKGAFRGVQNDTDRKGELFGIANLLKFKDGEFLRYRKENKRGIQVIRGGHVDEQVNKWTEVDFEGIGGNVLVEAFDNHATLDTMATKGGDPTLVGGIDNDDESSHMGADSQAMIAIGDRVIFSPDDSTVAMPDQTNEEESTIVGPDHGEREPDIAGQGFSKIPATPTKSLAFEPETPSSPLGMTSPQSKAIRTSKSPDHSQVIPQDKISETDKDVGQMEEDSAQSLSLDVTKAPEIAIPPERDILNRPTPTHMDTLEKSIPTNCRASSAVEQKQSSSKRRKRNYMLAGMSRDHIKQRRNDGPGSK